MVASRYDTPAQANGVNKNPTSSSASGNTSGTSEQTSTSNTSRSGKTDSSTQNMDDGQLAALNSLIQQLSSGGTSNMNQDRATKQGEIGTLQNQRQGYSKEAGFADAQGLIAQTMRQALEKLVPSINAGAMGAGASQSSMRALLTQRAGENAAEAASAQGLTAAVNYGGVSNGISAILERLIAQQDPSTAALINALAVAKGSTVNSTTTSNETGTNNSVTLGQTAGTSKEDKFIEYDGGPKSISSTPNVQVFGDMTQKPVASVGTSADFLNQLYGNSGSWDNYKF